MADAKNHHYVPQAILRRFVNGKGRLHVYDKWTRRTFQSATRNVASENGFYDVNVGGETIGLESTTEQIDAPTLAALSRIVEDESLAYITPEDRTLLAVLLAFQLLRTRAARDLFAQMQEEFRRVMPSKGIDESVLPDGFFADEEQLKLESIRSWRLVSDIAATLLMKQWLLLEPPPGVEFITSDNPLVRRNSMPAPPYTSNNGIKCRGIEMFVPLTPRLTLELMCEDTVREFRNHQQDYPHTQIPFLDTIDSGTPLRIVEDTVDYANSLQVVCSTRFVFSSSGDFSLIERILDANPELAHLRQIAVT